MSMELFQEFLFTVGLSLLVSFVIAKVISMASYDDGTVTGDNSVSVSVIGVIEEAVFCEKQDRDEKPVVWDSENGGRVCFVDKVVGFNELEEEEDEEEAGAETVRSPLACENDEVADCDDVSKEFVFSDEAKGGVLEEEEERAIVGGDVFEVNFAFGSSEKENSREIRILSEGLVGRFRDIEIESAEEVRVLESSEESRGNEGERLDQSNGNEEEEEEEVGLFDDWEGIERTELEKRFGEAMMFVGSKTNADRISSLDSDTKMQLYGLQKAAIEGPCRVPQPMALKVSARAKW